MNDNSLFLLRLPAEIRLLVYEYVIGRRVVYVRMSWSGVCIPSGFLYCCLNNTTPLLEAHQKSILAQAVTFGPDLVVLSQVCRQMRKETAILPFQCYVWAFETPWTLDQFISMKRSIPNQYKYAIRMVAVPTPGPYRSSERVLTDLHTVLLIGPVKIDANNMNDTPLSSAHPRGAILILRKAKTDNTWVRGDDHASFTSGMSSTSTSST